MCPWSCVSICVSHSEPEQVFIQTGSSVRPGVSIGVRCESLSSSSSECSSVHGVPVLRERCRSEDRGSTHRWVGPGIVPVSGHRDAGSWVYYETGTSGHVEGFRGWTNPSTSLKLLGTEGCDPGVRENSVKRRLQRTGVSSTTETDGGTGVGGP